MPIIAVRFELWYVFLLNNPYITQCRSNTFESPVYHNDDTSISLLCLVGVFCFASINTVEFGVVQHIIFKIHTFCILVYTFGGVHQATFQSNICYQLMGIWIQSTCEFNSKAYMEYVRNTNKTSFTDADAPSGLSWTNREVMTTVQGVFEHKTQYILIHAPFTRIVVIWYIGNVPPAIS